MENYSVLSDDKNDQDSGTKVISQQQVSRHLCPPDSVMSLDSNLLNQVTSSNSENQVLISSKYNKINILSIDQPSFTTDSLKFSITDRSKKNVNLTFPVRLNTPPLNGTSDSKINDTACIQYLDLNNPDYEACTTWYDYKTNTVLCFSKREGY